MEFLKKLDSDKKRLLENFLSLSILQGVNYILPLITLPYLVRVLGPEKFGLIAFAQAFIQYFNILTDYGFNLSATREISIHRKDKEKISEIFSSVMIIKFALLILSFIIMTIIVFSFDKFKKDWLIYYLTFGTVVGQILFPVWFFQGMERMKYITFLNIVARLIFTISIFIFVHKVSDYIYVPMINSLGFLVVGILSVIIILRDFKIKFIIPNKLALIHHLKEGGYIFISRISISFYTVSNVFILGLLTSNTVVSYYSVAEKLINIVRNFYNIILQVMYPFVSRLVTNRKEEALEYVKKEIKLSMTGGIIVSGLIVFLANPLISSLFGNEFLPSILVLQVLSIIPTITMISAIIGQQILLNFRLRRVFTLSIIYPSMFHIPLLILLVKIFSALGAALAVIITESLVLLFRLVLLWKKRKDLFKTILA
ncbi:MAG: flippase [Desulfurobacteriaceae bacterium]